MNHVFFVLLSLYLCGPYDDGEYKTYKKLNLSSKYGLLYVNQWTTNIFTINLHLNSLTGLQGHYRHFVSKLQPQQLLAKRLSVFFIAHSPHQLFPQPQSMAAFSTIQWATHKKGLPRHWRCSLQPSPSAIIVHVPTNNRHGRLALFLAAFTICNHCARANQ